VWSTICHMGNHVLRLLTVVAGLAVVGCGGGETAAPIDTSEDIGAESARMEAEAAKMEEETSP
jgi:hypothetical protein